MALLKHFFNFVPRGTIAPNFLCTRTNLSILAIKKLSTANVLCNIE